MRWTNLVVACVLPALVGCGAWRDRAPGDARGAWRAVRERHPDRQFTAEFETGFQDGYAECTNCGGAARPPAVPPARFLRDRTYLTAAGHGLVRDYYSGFQYGTEVAAANGHGLSVPAHYSPAPAVPYVPARGAPSVSERRIESEPAVPPAPVRNKFDGPLEARAVPADPGAARSKLPKPEVPVIPPFNPDLSKFNTVFVPESDRLPVPVPALPVTPERPRPLPAPTVAQPPLPSVPSVKVPASSPQAPAAGPAGVPVIPFKH